ncbi:hypothetical protein EYF80_041139 [Liparis tanakae]|uniref:Uncharacterized protein n=1 Tax=Liparis tanakae TaxID=230148 RepID=A0A4Z2G501_9TELE|nr:hypothetical protein EYF80_041139 [Liparis tanakae]
MQKSQRDLLAQPSVSAKSLMGGVQGQRLRRAAMMLMWPKLNSYHKTAAQEDPSNMNNGLFSSTPTALNGKGDSDPPATSLACNVPRDILVY